MQQVIYWVIVYLGMAILTLNVGWSVFKWKELPRETCFFFLFLFWNLSIEVVAKLDIYYGILGNNNLPVLHLYTLGEFALLFLFYNRIIQTPSWLQQFRWTIFLVVINLILANSCYIQEITTFNTYAKTLVQILVIALSILYFFNLLEKEAEEERKLNGLRLINSAILIYYSGSLIIFMFGNYFLFIRSDSLFFWTINAFLNLVFHLLILIALWRMTSRSSRFSYL